MERSLDNVAAEIKAVADAHRIKILQLLANEGEKCVNDICKNLDISQPVTSYHLKKLKKHGLVAIRRDNKKIFYSINPNSTATKFVMNNISITINT